MPANTLVQTCTYDVLVHAQIVYEFLAELESRARPENERGEMPERFVRMKT